MAAQGCLYVPAASPALRFAEGIAWLWRLGPVMTEPTGELVGFGWAEEAAELHALIAAGELAGGVVFVDRPGSDVGPLPGRARRRGLADFGGGDVVQGQFACLTEGRPGLRSSLGVHTVREGNWLVVGADPSAVWGALDGFWILPALAEFLVEVLERPLVMLPPIGWARYDDVPGNGQEQLLGRAKTDAEWEPRLERLEEIFADSGAVLNVAVSARGLVGEREAPLEQLWPGAVARLRDGIQRGAFEVVSHGYLHLDPDALISGRAEPREFARMPYAEAARRLDAALEWASGALGTTPRSFVAPNWAYGDGILEALQDRGLPAWLPPQPGPLLQGLNPRESMISTLEGLHGLHYGPLRRFAEVGYPPTLVIHGGLFDGRFQALSLPRDALVYWRLYRRRDIFRAPWTPGIRWVGAAELIDHLLRHDRVEVGPQGIMAPPGTVAIVRDREGSRLLGDAPSAAHRTQ